MNILPVNNRPDNQVDGPYKSMWLCSDHKNCGHDIYNEISVTEYMWTIYPQDNTDPEVVKLSEKYETPLCDKCDSPTDLAVLTPGVTAWICKCGEKGVPMKITVDRWIEKLERGWRNPNA